MLARAERASLAEALLAESVEKQGIMRGALTIHSDGGSPMIAKPVAHLLADLGVTKSHSRPHVSNDNPYSASQFRTFKYRPDFPKNFGSFEDAHAHCGRFFDWYNDAYCPKTRTSPHAASSYSWISPPSRSRRRIRGGRCR
jgi:putative transposase